MTDAKEDLKNWPGETAVRLPGRKVCLKCIYGLTVKVDTLLIAKETIYGVIVKSSTNMSELQRISIKESSCITILNNLRKLSSTNDGVYMCA